MGPFFSVPLSLSVSRSWHRRCLSLSFLPLPTFDERVEKKKVEPFSLEQDVVNSNVISLSVCFTCLYHTHLLLFGQTQWALSTNWPGTDPLTLPTSETSSTGVSWEAVRSWCQICLAVDGERWTRRCSVALSCLFVLYLFLLVMIQSLAVDAAIKAPF